jgi:hypothetical protein
MNLPIDATGRELTLSRFTSMPDDLLIRWRDHLVNSFPAEAGMPFDATNSFRFKRPDGVQPHLTLLEMGTTTKDDPPRPRKRKMTSRSTSRPRPQKKLKETQEVNSLGEIDALETFRDEEGGTPSLRGHRMAGQKAKGRIAHDASMDDIEEDPSKYLTSTKSIFASSRSFPNLGRKPGSDQEQQKAQLRIAANTPILDSSEPTKISMYLTKPHGMDASTLPEEWKKHDWNAEIVSYNLHFTCYIHSHVTFTYIGFRCITAFAVTEMPLIRASLYWSLTTRHCHRFSLAYLHLLVVAFQFTIRVSSNVMPMSLWAFVH